MIRNLVAGVVLVWTAHSAVAQVSVEDKRTVKEVMEKATAKFGENQQRALKDVATKGGFKGGNDRLSAVTPEEFASVLKGMGLLSGSTEQPAFLTLGSQMATEEGEARAKIIRGYFLIEQSMLLSKKAGFKFSDLPEADRKLILANLDKCGDELLFAGLPYAERASVIRKRFVGK